MMKIGCKKGVPRSLRPELKRAFLHGSVDRNRQRLALALALALAVPSGSFYYGDVQTKTGPTRLLSPIGC